MTTNNETAIIAQRLEDGSIRFGRTGDSARTLYRLLERDFPFRAAPNELFDKGCPGFLDSLWASPVEGPMWLGVDELDIFNTIAPGETIFFHDWSGAWSVILPGSPRVKIPLEVVANVILGNGWAWRPRAPRLLPDEEKRLYEFLEAATTQAAEMLPPASEEVLAKAVPDDDLSGIQEFRFWDREERIRQSLYRRYWVKVWKSALSRAERFSRR